MRCAALLILVACNTPQVSITDIDPKTDQDNDGFSSPDDCDDTDPDVHPDADELCDGIDNNCDGQADEGLSTQPYYADTDQDGHGDPNNGTDACAAPDGHVDSDGDCDDADPDVHPGAPELCDGVDRDCDGLTNEADATDAQAFYADTDGDGFGDPGNSTAACEPPSGHVSDDTDCDDTDSTVFPGSHTPEVPFDGRDQDCDGLDVCVDLGCDRWPDLVFPSFSDGFVYEVPSRVYLGSERGYADDGAIELDGVAVSDADSGDFNGDGYVDVLLTGSDHTVEAPTSWIYWGTASGLQATAPQEITAPNGWRSCTADLNQDGYTDALVVAHSPLGEVKDATLFWGGPSGLVAQASLPSNNSYDCALVDLDADGWLDIFLPAFGGSGEGVIYWSEGGEHSQFSSSALPDFDYTLHASTADVDGDGLLDLLLGSHYNADGAWMASGEGYSPDERIGVGASYLADLAAADLDNNGETDLVGCTYFSPDVTYETRSQIHWDVTSDAADAPVTELETHGCRDVGVEDVDRDGFLDLIFMNFVAGTQEAQRLSAPSHVYYGSASGFSTADRTELDSHGSQHVVLGDLNLDGYPELVLGNYQDSSYDHTVDSIIYWGGATGYGAAQTSLDTTGVAGAPLIIP